LIAAFCCSHKGPPPSEVLREWVRSTQVCCGSSRCEPSAGCLSLSLLTRHLSTAPASLLHRQYNTPTDPANNSVGGTASGCFIDSLTYIIFALHPTRPSDSGCQAPSTRSTKEAAGPQLHRPAYRWCCRHRLFCPTTTSTVSANRPVQHLLRASSVTEESFPLAGGCGPSRRHVLRICLKVFGTVTVTVIELRRSARWG
jgi:hypothetical protein